MLIGRGVDEERLVKIIAHRSSSQQKEIRDDLSKNLILGKTNNISMDL